MSTARGPGATATARDGTLTPDRGRRGKRVRCNGNQCGAIAVALLAFACAQLDAQGPGLGAIVLTQPGSTRALGMGNAFVLGSVDSDAVFYNAAIPEQLRGFGGALNLLPQANLTDGRLFTASAGMEWWGGAVAFGMQALTHEAIGPEIFPGSISASGIAASVAYTRRIRGLRLAATAKLVEQKHASSRDATAALDLATAANFGIVSLGLAIQNLGPDLKFDFLDAPTDLPRRVTLAASTRARPLGPLDVLGTGAVSADFDGDLTGGLGAEVAYWPVSGRTFFARIGGLRNAAEDTHLTLGAGFWGDRIALDYAYVAEGEGAHRVGVRWR